MGLRLPKWSRNDKSLKEWRHWKCEREINHWILCSSPIQDTTDGVCCISAVSIYKRCQFFGGLYNNLLSETANTLNRIKTAHSKPEVHIRQLLTCRSQNTNRRGLREPQMFLRTTVLRQEVLGVTVSIQLLPHIPLFFFSSYTEGVHFCFARGHTYCSVCLVLLFIDLSEKNQISKEFWQTTARCRVTQKWPR